MMLELLSKQAHILTMAVLQVRAGGRKSTSTARKNHLQNGALTHACCSDSNSHQRIAMSIIAAAAAASDSTSKAICRCSLLVPLAVMIMDSQCLQLQSHHHPIKHHCTPKMIVTKPVYCRPETANAWQTCH